VQIGLEASRENKNIITLQLSVFMFFSCRARIISYHNLTHSPTAAGNQPKFKPLWTYTFAELLPIANRAC